MLPDCSLAANACQAQALAQKIFGACHAQNMERYPHEEFGKRLSQLIDISPYREESQRRLGLRFGVSGPTVNEWKKGKKLPGMENAITIAIQLNCCVEYLLTGRGPKRPGLPDEDGDGEHLDISHLPQGQQVHLRALVHSIQQQGPEQQKKVAND